MWDIDDDGRMEVLVTDSDGKLFCQELGDGTWNKETSLPPHLHRSYTTYQWDNYEPNEGGPLDASNIPTETIQIPSALTAQGDFYSYLQSPEDKDYFVVNTRWSASICLQTPKNRAYSMEVYSYKDKWNNDSQAPEADGKIDGLIWTGKSAPGGQLCFSGGAVVPARKGEYKYVIGIKSANGDYSPYWPYWLKIVK